MKHFIPLHPLSDTFLHRIPYRNRDCYRRRRQDSRRKPLHVFVILRTSVSSLWMGEMREESFKPDSSRLTGWNCSNQSSPPSLTTGTRRTKYEEEARGKFWRAHPFFFFFFYRHQAKIDEKATNFTGCIRATLPTQIESVYSNFL